MRRPAHGGTARPGPARPGSGYGRPERSRPAPIGRDEMSTDPVWWFERELEFERARLDLLDADRSTERA